ncbi:MAG: hypothetical protein HQL35_14605 [Alphaproteobacteria bacterium]|nr:hypothetical protein [Alphaproteobacteria bacterium]
MIGAREATLSLAGALRIARFDARGMLFFNASVAGFWRSFWVAALIAPFHFLYVALVWRMMEEGTSLARYVSLEVIVYVCGWVAFPLAMVTVSQLLERTERFLLFATAYNWTQLVLAAIGVPVQIAVVTGLLSGAAMSIALAGVIVYALVLTWFLARRLLGVGDFAAALVVVVELAVSYVIQLFGVLML